MAAETKTEAELRKQLAAAQAALAAEQARTKALQTGTQKLSEAVAVQAESSKESNRKLEAVSDQIEATQETVKNQTAIARKATEKLAETVSAQTGNVTSAIAAQVSQQKRSLEAAREVARKLEESNKELAKSNAENLRAKEESNKRLAELTQSITDLQHKAELVAAQHDVEITTARYQMLNSLSNTLGVPLLTLFGSIVLWLQIKASRSANESKKAALLTKDHQRQVSEETASTLGEIKAVQQETHKMVNGRLDALLQEVERLKAENLRLTTEKTADPA